MASSEAFEALADTPKMSAAEIKFISDSITDLLPDSPHLALTVLALTYANVAVATGCPESQAHEALRRSFVQMIKADRSPANAEHGVA